MKKPRFAAVLAATTLISACSSITIDSRMAPEGTVAGKSTFALIHPTYGAGEKSPAVLETIDKRIAPEVVAALKGKGYTEAPNESADLLAAIQLSSTGQVEATRYGYSTSGWEMWGSYWGGSAYGYTKSYDTALLVVDIVDAKKKTVLYRGLAKGAYRVNGDPTQDDIRGFVTKMLKEFPGRS
jgi:hypothetical protein